MPFAYIFASHIFVETNRIVPYIYAHFRIKYHIISTMTSYAMIQCHRAVSLSLGE